jgi:hypothetical protein
VPGTRVAVLEPVIGAERYARLLTVAAQFRDRLGRRTIWNVNSTAVGGGVAEMLQVLVGYIAGLGIAVRWTVIGGDPDFFAITKRLHNQIHGEASGAGQVGSADAAITSRSLPRMRTSCSGRCAQATSCCCMTRRRAPGTAGDVHDHGASAGYAPYAVRLKTTLSAPVSPGRANTS